MILVFPGLGVHQYLCDAVERSEDELIQHESNHDRLRTAVRRGHCQAGIEVERREEGFVVDKQGEGGEGEEQMELGDPEQLGRVRWGLSAGLELCSR